MKAENKVKAVLNNLRMKVFYKIHTESFCKDWDSYWFKESMEIPDKSLTEQRIQGLHITKNEDFT